MNAIALQKKELRENLRKESREARHQAIHRSHAPHVSAPNYSLNEQLIELLTRIASSREKALCWASFQALQGEPDLKWVSQRLSDLIDWVYPRIENDQLVFYRPGPVPQFVSGKWGVLEPTPDPARRVTDEKIEGILIPGMAFDAFGNRLGRGAGFYDKALARVEEKNSQLIKVGVCFESQMMEEPVPVEELDISMTWIVTESRCLRTGSSRTGANAGAPRLHPSVGAEGLHANNQQDRQDE